MSMRLWIDDIRNAPDDTWHVARTVTDAIRVLSQVACTEISIDHDISHEVTVDGISRPYPCSETFMPVARYMALLYRLRQSVDIAFPTITIHSSNVVAGKEMKAVLEEAGITDIVVSPMGLTNRLEQDV